MSSDKNKTIQKNIFVYGEMMRGDDNNFLRILRKSASYIGIAFLKNGNVMQLADYRGAMTHTKKEGTIIGMLYSIKSPETTLKRLDNCKEVGESFPDSNYYCRREQLVYARHNTALYAWVYTATKTNTASSYSVYLRTKIKSIKKRKSLAYLLANKKQ